MSTKKEIRNPCIFCGAEGWVEVETSTWTTKRGYRCQKCYKGNTKKLSNPVSYKIPRPFKPKAKYKPARKKRYKSDHGTTT